DTAIRGKDLDETKAQAAKKAAEESLKKKDSNIDFAMAEAELAEAVAQIQAIAKLRKK
ncbi:MAG: F0F1 ATP synthase subunit epsilon, partial [Nitrosomonadales bacterium]|nr:F0F1 ATP synthase subunit epsilon [Nitrosomonadales bacterium]